MQLNNITTGQVALLISSNNTGIAYDIYENAIYAIQKTYNLRQTIASEINKDIVPVNPKSINELIELLSYTKILELLTEYEITEDDTKNWCIDTGSTGMETTVRVLIPNSLVSESLGKMDNLGQLILGMITTLRDYAITSEHCIVQYLEELLPAHKALLESYTEIVIDERI